MGDTVRIRELAAMLMPSIVPVELKQIKLFKAFYKDVMGPHGKGSNRLGKFN